ncbi:Leucine-rich repeat-containing protein 4, partial [Cichlidogyrus casuarinus]
MLLFVLLLASLVDRLHAVRGCHLFNNLDSKELKAKCINPKYNFQVIPQNLNIDIVELTINNQFIESISGKQFSHLPNLTLLDLSSNGLKSIESGTFRQLTKLTNLTLRGNRVSFERGSFFPEELPGLKNLVHLDMRFNPIESIPDNFFNILGASLKVMQLSSTSTEAVRIQPRAFDGLRNLVELDLSHGNLSSLPAEMRISLDRMTHLRRLDLRGNNWNCDCNIKWLKNWLEMKLKTYNIEPYSSALGREPILNCYYPMHLRDRPLIGLSAVSSNELRCAPSLLNKGYTITIDQRSNLTLVCQFHADPVVSVEWYKDDKKVEHTWPNIQLSQNYTYKFDANLTIFFVGRQHQGRWSCAAGSGKDRVSTDYYVQ